MILNLLLVFMIRLISPEADEQPMFKGGQKNLNIFISNNLIYPEYSKTNCLQGTVSVSFKLNRLGRIYQSEVQKGYGIDLDKEALRIIRLTSGKWIVPASHDTTVSIVLPVNFTLKDFKCEERSRDDITAAIKAYHARAGLSEAVFNFYRNKAQGNYEASGETAIQALKLQLGYTEKFIEQLLKQAQRKLKQEDFESACEDFETVRLLGSDKAASFIIEHCK